MSIRIIKLLLRFGIGASFLSAAVDRFGWWSEEVSAWGNWGAFLEYTQMINPWFPESTIPALAVIATAAEIIFGVCLIVGFKTELMAKLSGFLLLIFALSMTFSTGLKSALDYSVYTAAAGAFALSLMSEKYFELDSLIWDRKEAGRE